MAVYFDGLIGCPTLQCAKETSAAITSLEYIHPPRDREFRNRDGLWWVSFLPKGLGLGVPYDSDLNRETYSHRRQEIALAIHGELKGIKNFEIALLGWEVTDRWFDPTETEFVSYGTVRVPVNTDKSPGLIVSQQIWETIEDQSMFQRFAQGLYWVHRENWEW